MFYRREQKGRDSLYNIVNVGGSGSGGGGGLEG